MARIPAHVDKRLTSAVKLLCKVNSGRLISNGERTITNGHWLVRFSTEVWETLPDTLDLGKIGFFPIKKKCTLTNGHVFDDCPDVERLIKDVFDESTCNADFETEDKNIKCLIHKPSEDPEIYKYVLKPEKGARYRVHVSKPYMDRLLKLVGLDKWKMPEGMLTVGKDKLDPVLIRYNGCDVVLMPVTR